MHRVANIAGVTTKNFLGNIDKTSHYQSSNINKCIFIFIKTFYLKLVVKYPILTCTIYRKTSGFPQNLREANQEVKTD